MIDPQRIEPRYISNIVYDDNGQPATIELAERKCRQMLDAMNTDLPELDADQLYNGQTPLKTHEHQAEAPD